jgi:hypothetical protein
LEYTLAGTGKGIPNAAHLLALHRFSIVIIGLVVWPDDVDLSIGPIAAAGIGERSYDKPRGLAAGRAAGDHAGRR